jgi:hypothetical protein
MEGRADSGPAFCVSISGEDNPMKSVAALLLLVWCGCVQADVYKWTEAQGEVHYGENPPASVPAAKVMTQEQIERAGQSNPPPASQSDTGQAIDEAVQERLAECQRFKSLRDEFLMNLDQPGRSLAPLAGYGVAYVTRENEQSSGIMEFSDIEANIRKYCLE